MTITTTYVKYTLQCKHAISNDATVQNAINNFTLICTGQLSCK